VILALVGSGEYLPPIENVDRELIARLRQPPRVVCLPTAAGREGPERIDYWMSLGVEHFTRLGAQVNALPIVDRASADDPALAAEISSANFVYLSGGKPDYLYKTLEGSRAGEAIRSVLSTGGLLAGCSAGAMVLGEKYLGFPSLRAGFNFLPRIVVLPHYDEIPKTAAQMIRLLVKRSLTLVGIEGNTGLVLEGDRYQVLGSGGVMVWNKTSKTLYTRGPINQFP